MSRAADTAARGVTPGRRYRAGIAAAEWHADPAQLAVLPEFDRL
jgi:cell division protein ZapE